MNLRILSTGLLLVAACVLWMGVGSATATTLTSPIGTAYTGSIVAESEGHVTLDNPIAAISCAVKIEGEIETHGEGVTAGGKVKSLAFSGCTNSWHVTVVSAGSLEFHDIGSGNDTVTSTGATIEATRLGITCRYTTNNTHIGTLTGGSPATVHLEAQIPFHSGSFLCGTAATAWTGSYKIPTPSPLNVIGATVTRKVTLNEVEVKDCNFVNEGEKCVIKFNVNGEGEGWRVEKTEWEGEKAEVRYKKAVSCTVGKLMKDKESCTDEIEMVKKEAGTENRWCVVFELEGGGAKNVPFCTKLTM